MIFLSQKYLCVLTLRSYTMRLLSQSERTIDDMFKEAGGLKIHGSLPQQRASELFEEASRELDPAMYTGGFRPYKSEGKGDDADELLRRMGKELPQFSELSQEDTYATVPPPSASFENIATSYLGNEAGSLYEFLSAEGREFYDITLVGTTDLGEGAIAGLARSGNEAALIGDTDFYKKAVSLASQYASAGVTVEDAMRYVLDHEFAHASQKGLGYDDTIQLESDVENALMRFYHHMAEKHEGSEEGRKYEALATIASDRAGSVAQNYGGLEKARQYRSIEDILPTESSYSISAAGASTGAYSTPNISKGAYAGAAPAKGSYSKAA